MMTTNSVFAGQLIPEAQKGFFGKKVKAKRMKLKKLAKEVAQFLGCSRSYVSQIENGIILPTAEMLGNLADAIETKLFLLWEWRWIELGMIDIPVPLSAGLIDLEKEEVKRILFRIINSNREDQFD